jgi:hypothetical protein
MKKTLIASAICLASSPVFAELTVEPYGSIRAQAESVSVDQVTADQATAGENDSYTGIKDAYSRFGVIATYPLSNGTTLGAKLEIPFNIQKMQAEDPSYFDDNSPRVYKLTATGDWGSAAIGKQWLAYYNAIAYPVDYFSSFYSGFATYASFRREAVTYTTPSFAGFSATASMVDMVDGGDESLLDTTQASLNYSLDGLDLALAYQDSYNGQADLLGASAAYTTGPWRFATKVEQLDSPAGTVDADPMMYNMYASYQLKNYTFKAHYAKGDVSDDGGAYFQGDSYHLGADYQYTKNLKVFVEYFYEERGYAIYPENADTYDALGGYQDVTNGSALAIGARYDF